MFQVAEEQRDKPIHELNAIVIIHQVWLTPQKLEAFWPPHKLHPMFRHALEPGKEPTEEWIKFKMPKIIYGTSQRYLAAMFMQIWNRNVVVGRGKPVTKWSPEVDPLWRKLRQKLQKCDDNMSFWHGTKVIQHHALLFLCHDVPCGLILGPSDHVKNVLLRMGYLYNENKHIIAFYC